ANWMHAPASVVHEVDVVYFYPTAYSPSGPDAPAVGPIDDAGMRAGARESYRKQATAFETCANIYAPFYRQIDAMTLAGLTQEEMIEAESGEPKTDVFAALDYYFEHWNDGRPFMLAGHSQGAMMTYLVLAEYMKQHPDRYARMVAAYMIGNAPTDAWLTENPHVKLATGADDTGVLLSWNTEGPGNQGKYNMVVPEGARCINPLNWRTDGTYAGVELNKGCLVKNETTGAYEVVPGFADAQIDPARGSVICRSVDPAQYAVPAAMQALFGPESYHGWDFGFYYMNIRENAANRAKHFLERNAKGGSSGCDTGAVSVAAAILLAALGKLF
ncbi:DUF3089 domain-containing protein, partial [Synergistaceae bacterium OttesenSCG-928-I11]|nr:DUF3089 domain-containing protein [Synergistaceae bacterium OttesenSCG-928-I11]